MLRVVFYYNYYIYCIVRCQKAKIGVMNVSEVSSDGRSVGRSLGCARGLPLYFVLLQSD